MFIEFGDQAAMTGLSVLVAWQAVPSLSDFVV